MNAPDTPAAKTENPLTPAAYNTLVAAARLQDIRLVKSDFLLDADGFEYAPDWKMQHSCEIQSAHFDEDSHTLIVWVAAEAVCKKKNKKLVSSRCRYVVIYDVQGEPEEAAVSAFSRRVARFSVYPYFRAHFAETCSQAGLRLPPLPVIKETKVINRVSAAGEDAKQIAEGQREKNES